MMVTMSMEEYKRYEILEEKHKAIRHLARECVREHANNNDWARVDDMQENLTFDEAKLLLKKILN